MPLHLLSKKSWNVYAPANRARVARDEALAEAEAKDAERDRRDDESGARIDTLKDDSASRSRHDLTEQDKLLLKATKDLTAGLRDSRKRKRLPGENDTDRDLRHAKESQVRRSEHAVARLRADRNGEADAPIVDDKGHINLFPERTSKHERQRKSELQREREQQREAQEEQGMQLKDAWGRKDGHGAWYLDTDGAVKDSTGKDVWGNEDPRRQQRQAQRLVSSDPLAFMKKAQVQLKVSRREREERETELRKMRQRARRELSDFALDEEPGRSNYHCDRRQNGSDRHKSRRKHQYNRNVRHSSRDGKSCAHEHSSHSRSANERQR